MHDLVIRRGTIVDGSGDPSFEADLAVDGGRISRIGSVPARGREEVDASGKIVTPGWVDVHTHYDAQVTWDPTLSPSGWHGVTTVVMGNCGVGFAPANPDRHDWLIGLMEGVEDIPGAALHEGIQWGWESFPEYLEVLSRRPSALDFAAQVPHGALRAYVMGERGARNEAANAEDIQRMAALVEEGVAAGALGFSTSRTLIHKGSDGEYVPGTFAAEDELLGIAAGLARGGGGVFQMTANHKDMLSEIPWMRQVAERHGLPVSFNLMQTDEAPELYRQLLAELDRAAADGLSLFGQVAGRPAGILMAFEGTAVPFFNTGTFLNLFHASPQERRQAALDPAFRAKVLADEVLSLGPFEDFILQTYDKMFRLGQSPDYEPDPSQSAAAVARAQGRSPREVVYDWLLEGEGRGIIYFPVFNYSWGDMDHMRELLTHPRTVLGLGDGGAHCGTICDVSVPTFMLTHWVMNRQRGPRLPLEQVVQMQTSQTAALYGLRDRGLLAPGYRADINLIDLDRLSLSAPEMIYDLPAGGRRFVQRAQGYEATWLKGELTFQEGVHTGALPGGLIKGRPAAP